MKKNNKGFMLAEVVITSTIVMTAMISLYFTFNKLYARYNTLTTYKNIDGMYAIENIIDDLIEDQNINIILATKNGKIIANGNCQVSTNYCNETQEAYNIENMYMVKMNNTQIDNLKTGANATLQDYLDYTKKYYKFDGNHYLIILEYKNGDEFNYSSMELG